jgi:hypothetical protein
MLLPINGIAAGHGVPRDRGLAAAGARRQVRALSTVDIEARAV